MIVTLAGHVDHGKTAIVQALTGTNTDRLKEEQERGLTIDLGFAYTTLGEQRVGFVDVPGHTRFIHNMIAGVASQQHAMLIIAADDGVMPQTIEHTQILELLGIHSGTIVINKVDLVDQERLEQLRTEVSHFTSSNFLRRSKIFEVSATQQTGFEALRDHLVAMSASFHQQHSHDAFRMAIDRSFVLQGVGTVVTGTVAAGQVKIGDQLHLTSSQDSVRVRSLNVQGEETQQAIFGDRCSLNIAGNDTNLARRGSWLCDARSVNTVQRVSVKLSLLADYPRKLNHWCSVHVYHLTDHCEAHIALIRSKEIQPGASELAELDCSVPMNFKAGDRLLIRDKDLSRTLGSAFVIGVVPSAIKRRRINRNLAALQSLSEAVEKHDPVLAIECEASQSIVNESDFRKFWNLNEDQFEDILGMASIERLGGYSLSRLWVEELRERLIEFLRGFHQTNPDVVGAPFNQITSAVPVSTKVIRFVLDLMVKREAIQLIRGSYSLPSHTRTTPQFDEQLYLTIKSLFDQQHPMSLGDVAKQLRKPLRDLESSIRPMFVANVLVQVAPNRVLTPERIDILKDQATQLASHNPFTVKEFRDVSGLGRNLAIDVLEYFDRRRITRRDGDTRVMVG